LKSRQIDNADPAHRVARVASGHAAAPPSNVMNSRRLMGLTPKAKDRGLSFADICGAAKSALFDHLVGEPARPRNGCTDEERYKLEPAAHTRRSFNREPIVRQQRRRVFLSLHFLFQYLTQYQERYWPNTNPNSQSLCVGFLQGRS